METVHWGLKMELTSFYFTRRASCKMEQRLDSQDFSELMVETILFKR